MNVSAARWALAMSWLLCAACDTAPGPATPSTPPSFLAGTWQGTLTLQVNPGLPDVEPSTSGTTTWTFEVVPQTNRQTFTATIRSTHAWLPITTVASTAIIPGNTPPVQISTQGEYASPRGCRGTFGSVGIAEVGRIDADFTGVDCGATFSGRMTLTKP
jgi:hypothetical protein